MKILITLLLLIPNILFSHPDDMSNKEYNLFDKYRTQGNDEAAIAIYNAHSLEGYPCTFINYKYLKEAGFCKDKNRKDIEEFRADWIESIIESYGPSASENFKDYEFKWEYPPYGHGQFFYAAGAQIINDKEMGTFSCEDKLTAVFKNNLNQFKQGNGGMFKIACPKTISFYEKIQKNDELLLNQKKHKEMVVNDRKKFYIQQSENIFNDNYKFQVLEKVREVTNDRYNAVGSYSGKDVDYLGDTINEYFFSLKEYCRDLGDEAFNKYSILYGEEACTKIFESNYSVLPKNYKSAFDSLFERLNKEKANNQKLKKLELEISKLKDEIKNRPKYKQVCRSRAAYGRVDSDGYRTVTWYKDCYMEEVLTSEQISERIRKSPEYKIGMAIGNWIKDNL